VNRQVKSKQKPLLAAFLVFFVFIFLLLHGCISHRVNIAPMPTAVPKASSTMPFPASSATPTIDAVETASQTPLLGVECVSDSDCVPSECCHPKWCVRASSAPNCSGVVCTNECKQGTMDCGKGRCVCINNRCGVSWIPKSPTPVIPPTPVPTPTLYYFARCTETDSRLDFTHRGTTAGEYNGIFSLWEDTCLWNGTDVVVREYYCVDAQHSIIVNYTEKRCLSQCHEGACDDECACGAGEHPVCGMDNRTYRSECFAQCAGTEVQMAEPCPWSCFQSGASCRTNSDCCSLKCAPWSKTCVECASNSDCGSKTCVQGRCA